MANEEDLYYFLPQGIADDGDDDESFGLRSAPPSSTATSTHFAAQQTSTSPFRTSSPEPFRPAGASSSHTPNTRQATAFDNGSQVTQQQWASEEGLYDALSGSVYHQGSPSLLPQHHRPRSDQRPTLPTQPRRGFRGPCRSGANCNNPNCEFDHSREDASLYNFRVPAKSVTSRAMSNGASAANDFRNVQHVDPSHGANSDGAPVAAPLGTVGAPVVIRQGSRKASDDLTQDAFHRPPPVSVPPAHMRPVAVQQQLPTRDIRPEISNVQNVRASIHVSPQPPQPQHTDAFASAPKEVWPTLNRLYAQQSNPPPVVTSPSPRRTAPLSGNTTSSGSGNQSKRAAKKPSLNSSTSSKKTPEQQARSRATEPDAFVQVGGKKQGQRQRKPRPLPTKTPAVSLVQASAFSVLSMRETAPPPDPEPVPESVMSVSEKVSPIITRQKRGTKKSASAPTTPKNQLSPKSTSSSPKTVQNGPRKTRRRSKSKSPSSSKTSLTDLPASVASVLDMQRDRETAQALTIEAGHVLPSPAAQSPSSKNSKSTDEGISPVLELLSTAPEDFQQLSDEPVCPPTAAAGLAAASKDEEQQADEVDEEAEEEDGEEENQEDEILTETAPPEIASPPPNTDDSLSTKGPQISTVDVGSKSVTEQTAKELGLDVPKSPKSMSVAAAQSKRKVVEDVSAREVSSTVKAKSVAKKGKPRKDSQDLHTQSSSGKEHVQTTATSSASVEIQSVSKQMHKELVGIGLRSRIGRDKKNHQVGDRSDDEEEEYDDERGDVHTVQSSDVDMLEDEDEGERSSQDDTTVLFNLNLLLTAVAALGSLLEKGKNAANGGPLRHALLMFHQIGSTFLSLLWSVVSVLASTHKHAMGVLALDHHLAFCFTFLYAFPYLVHYMTYWAPPWAAPCLWYAFLMQVFCTQGSPFLVSLFRLLLPLLFLTEGVSHHVLLLELNGAERLVVAYVLASFRTQEFYRPAFLLALSFEIVAALVYGSYVPVLPFLCHLRASVSLNSIPSLCMVFSFVMLSLPAPPLLNLVVEGSVGNSDFVLARQRCSIRSLLEAQASNCHLQQQPKWQSEQRRQLFD